MILIKSVLDRHEDRSILVPRGWTIVKSGPIKDGDRVLNVNSFKWYDAIEKGFVNYDSKQFIAIRKNGLDPENCHLIKAGSYYVYTFDGISSNFTRVCSKDAMQDANPYKLHFGLRSRDEYIRKFMPGIMH